MVDPCVEAAGAMENVKNAVTELLKNIGSIGKLANYVYLKLLTLRRAQFIEMIDMSNTAREMVHFPFSFFPFSRFKILIFLGEEAPAFHSISLNK